QTNQIHTLKVLSRPDQPGSEIVTGLAQFQQHQGIDPAEIGRSSVNMNAPLPPPLMPTCSRW
ncbi:hypothetical protein, partial [Pantoea agglomerans]|uniref:hypothetical protein n=1 Tax=Enterobacter agglomerans TaxID=549 RepID=UPI003F6E0A38